MFYERFAEKRRLKLVEWFSGHCRAETYHNAVCRSYTSRPSDPVAKYYLAKFGHAQKAKFRVLWFKSDTAVVTFTFRFLSSSFFDFLASLCFFCWAFSRLYFGGKSF